MHQWPKIVLGPWENIGTKKQRTENSGSPSIIFPKMDDIVSGDTLPRRICERKKVVVSEIGANLRMINPIFKIGPRLTRFMKMRTTKYWASDISWTNGSNWSTQKEILLIPIQQPWPLVTNLVTRPNFMILSKPNKMMHWVKTHFWFPSGTGQG